MAPIVESPPRPAAAPQRRRGTPVLIGALVGAWLVPAVCHLLHADVVLPVLVALGAASLLRGTRRLLDRLVIATGTLFGATTAAGLLLTYWPWGMHPVPTAGVALTALVVLARLTGRRPHLPRPRLNEVVAVLAAGCAAGMVAWPFLHRDFAGRLSLVAFRDDFSRQIALFDGVRAVGGYVFPQIHDPRVQAIVPSVMFRYPQGSHLMYGVLDGFLRSSTGLGSGRSLVDHYIGFAVLGFFFMSLAAAWAVLRIAGGRLGGFRYLVPVTVVAAYCGFSEPIFEFACGHTSAVAGVGLMTILVAMLSRPLSRIRDQLVVVASLLIGLGFTYYLFLPAAGLAVLGWLVARRLRVRQVWITALVCAVAVAALAPIVPIYGVNVGQTQALGDASSLVYSRALVLGVILVLAAGLASPVGRRLPVWRGYAWAFGCVLAETAGIGAYQQVRYGNAGYYFDKLLLLVLIVALAGLGVLSVFLPAIPRRPARGGLPARLATAVPAALLAGAVLTNTGLVIKDAQYHPYRQDYTTFGVWWFHGKSSAPIVADIILRGYEEIGDPKGSPVVVIAPERLDSYLSGLYLAAMSRELGASVNPVVSTLGIPTVSVEQLLEVSAGQRRPLRVAVPDGRMMATFDEIKHRRPDLNFVAYPL